MPSKSHGPSPRAMPPAKNFSSQVHGSTPIDPQAIPQPVLRSVPRDQHPISRKDISPNALRVLYRLREAGFGAFLVGGAVRDLLLGMHPKDFDVATDATPEQVKQLFRNCRLIGRRFRLAHVVYGREIIEVATFRANSDDGSGDREIEDGRLVRDNVYGTIEEDAVRRDFTCNALYYAIEDFSVRDYTGGFEDVLARRMRLIGDPETRYREDPVRMLRAVRLAAKLGFSIDPPTAEPIPRLAGLLAEAAPARSGGAVVMISSLPTVITGARPMLIAIIPATRNHSACGGVNSAVTTNPAAASTSPRTITRRAPQCRASRGASSEPAVKHTDHGMVARPACSGVSPSTSCRYWVMKM